MLVVESPTLFCGGRRFCGWWSRQLRWSRRLCSVVVGVFVGGVSDSVLWWATVLWLVESSAAVGGVVLWWAAQYSVATGWPAGAVGDAFTGSSQ